ncbi:hypothetical protein [Paraburkholderia sp.]|jgi:hypothetical protein|uniref:hypothetical protein n=1 Tax=Paraburkholderia sp. TaxID=1926495 RepID=UPI002F42472E
MAFQTTYGAPHHQKYDRRPNSSRRRVPGLFTWRRQARRQAKMGIVSEQGVCITGQSKMSGAHSAKLVHSEILHIKLVIGLLSEAELDRSGLPRAYWRKRLLSIMQSHQLSPTQFDEIDRILGALKN